jgi:chromosome segregation ATPase
MARFWNVGKANAEIARLEQQLAAVTKERDEAASAIESNTSEAATAATQLEADLVTARASIATLTTERDAAVKQSAAHVATISDLNAKLAKASEEVPVKVAQQVASTQAALGQPPLPAVPKEAAAATADKEKFGRERVLSACRAALSTLGYVQPQKN